jgi:hypothetical protein
MIFKAFINPETLEVTFDDPDVILNHIKTENGLIEIEIAKPDPESIYPHITPNTWQV